MSSTSIRRVMLPAVVVVAASLGCGKRDADGVRERPTPTAAAPIDAAPSPPLVGEPAPEVTETLFGEAMEHCAGAEPTRYGPRARFNEESNPEACTAWLSALTRLTLPSCVTLREQEDLKRVLESTYAAKALAKAPRPRLELAQARMAAVEALLALGRGNGTVFTMLTVKTWLDELDRATPGDPVVRTWRASLATRFPSARRPPSAHG